MWKFVTRGIRESLERRVCRTNVYSQNNEESIAAEQQQQHQQQVNEKQPKKCFLKELHKELKGPCLAAFAKPHCKHFGNRRRHEQRNYDDKYNWTEAVGWSGVLAFGYVVCQSLFIRRSLFDIDHSNIENWKKKLIVYPQTQATQAINNFLLPRPQYVFPVPKDLISKEQQSDELNEDISEDTNYISEDAFDYISEDVSEDLCVNVSEDLSEDLVDGVIDVKQEYGPITAEEALKQAIDEFSYANEVFLAELEFNSGVLAMEQKRFKDAVQHFTSGANMSSVRSMFNLGLCYELGLGTAKDFRKAVEYYAKAAKGGHVDAMYNLGVYFAQGKGGLSLSLSTAKHWFKEAAEKGQLKALRALQIEESYKKQFSSEKNNNRFKIKTMENVKINVMSKLVNYKNTLKSSIDSETESDEFSTPSNDDLNSPSPTDMFLGIMGLQEQNLVPLMSDGRSGS